MYILPGLPAKMLLSHPWNYRVPSLSAAKTIFSSYRKLNSCFVAFQKLEARLHWMFVDTLSIVMLRAALACLSCIHMTWSLWVQSRKCLQLRYSLAKTSSCSDGINSRLGSMPQPRLNRAKRGKSGVLGRDFGFWVFGVV